MHELDRSRPVFKRSRSACAQKLQVARYQYLSLAPRSKPLKCFQQVNFKAAGLDESGAVSLGFFLLHLAALVPSRTRFMIVKLERCPEQRMCYRARYPILVHVSALQRYASDGCAGAETCQIVIIDFLRGSCPRLRRSRLRCLRLQSLLHKSARAPEPSNPAGMQGRVEGAVACVDRWSTAYLCLLDERLQYT